MIAVRQTIASLPALQRASIDAGHSTDGTDPATFTASLLDVTHQHPTVFQTGHTSASVRKLFCKHQQGGRFGQCPVLAVEFAYQPLLSTAI